MPTIRRIYQYAITFISLEMILWGVCGLARLAFAGLSLPANTSRLAGTLSLVLAGLPVFAFHGWLVQRSLAQDPEERTARSRAFFLYGVLLSTLGASVVNFLALLNRVVLVGFRLDSALGFSKGQGSVLEDLVIVAINLLAAGGFTLILRNDWRHLILSGEYPDGAIAELARVRRLYRYIWLFIGMALGTLGLAQLIQSGLQGGQAFPDTNLAGLANGLTLLLVGLPTWIMASRLIRRIQVEPTGARSFIRLVALYGIVFISVVVVLASASQALDWALRSLLAGELAIGPLLSQMATPLSLAIPCIAIWIYYGRQLDLEMRLLDQAVQASLSNSSLLYPQTRHASLQRLYFYVLAFLGLAAAFIGLQLFLGYFLDMAAGIPPLAPGMRNNLADALSLLIAGLPLWIFSWRPMARRAAQEGAPGDHARRSLFRKSYLYLISFSAVIGGMISTGAMLYQLLNPLFGKAEPDFVFQILQQLKTSLLFWLILAWHGGALRTDQRLAEKALARLHAQFPVLILAPDEEEPEATGGFAGQIVRALHQQAPAMPVAVHYYSQGVPDETLSMARAVILPAELIARPAEAIRIWLQSYPGPRLVVPTPVRGWVWVSGRRTSMLTLANQVAQAVRRLAEEKT